jgi:hypothetical protein
MDNKQIVATGPINQAMELLKSGGDVASLEKMLELQERWEKNEARKAYHEAMTAFKADPPRLIKTKQVTYQTSKGQTDYKHADLANVVEIINSALSNHGLSASWKTNQENTISVKCTITHVLGHSESTTLSSPPDSSGGKNSIQAVGSTVTYLQRYTLLALLGLAAHDQDNDGQSASNDIVKDKLFDDIADLKTVPETEQYYRENHKKYPNLTAELIKMLAARKAQIVEELSNDNS